MSYLNEKLPSTGGGPDLLPNLPDPKTVEIWVMTQLGFLQKYGVLITLTCVVMFYYFYRLAKIRKNLVFAKFWMVTSWGMVVLTVLFIVLPYIVLGFY